MCFIYSVYLIITKRMGPTILLPLPFPNKKEKDVVQYK